MEVSCYSGAGQWSTFTALTIGLVSIFFQLCIVIKRTDIYGSFRNGGPIESWSPQKPRKWYESWLLSLTAPLHGPVITANLRHGFCGELNVCLRRIPSPEFGQMSWDPLLFVLQSTPIRENKPVSYQSHRKNTYDIESQSIFSLPQPRVSVGLDEKRFVTEPHTEHRILATQRLQIHKETACIEISRTTLLTLLCLTNARPTLEKSSASKYRVLYGSYCGQWIVEWPLGERARVSYYPHDSHGGQKEEHQLGEIDDFPVAVEQRVDKCVEMLAGVVCSSQVRCGFPGRKSSGRWELQFLAKGFALEHSGRHLYKMNGGDVYSLDFLHMREIGGNENVEHDTILHLPNEADGMRDVTVYVPQAEVQILDRALDGLPWNFLPWSIHRGLRDLLVAFAKKRMSIHRNRLAKQLSNSVKAMQQRLVERGWKEHFVQHHMPDMAFSAVSAERGNSGDAVRLITEIAFLMPHHSTNLQWRDETTFWSQKNSHVVQDDLSTMDIVALVKVLTLERSNELDYQGYHKLPNKLLLG